jgi:hypothetical protein
MNPPARCFEFEGESGLQGWFTSLACLTAPETCRRNAMLEEGPILISDQHGIRAVVVGVHKVLTEKSRFFLIGKY